jgi:hypothetical protein
MLSAPETTQQRIIAARSDEDVVDGRPGDRVVEAVAGSGEAAAAVVGQVLDIGRERVAGERGHDGVGALVGIFERRVADIVDIEEVVAVIAAHGVRADAAVQAIGSVPAQDSVVERVAGAGETGGARAEIVQVLDIGAERIGAEIANHPVGALVGILDHRIADVVDIESVVAVVAVQNVRADAAVQVIGAVPAPDRVVERVAGPGETGSARPDIVKVLDIGRERVGRQIAVDLVGARRDGLENDVTSVVDDVGVVAVVALQGVRAGSPVQIVVAVIRLDDVVERISVAGEVGGKITDVAEVLDVLAERIRRQ